MAQMLSPGVYIEEVDASAIIPNVSANIAFLAGNFNDGPVDQPYIVTTKQEYEQKFGTPTNRNYNEWFQGFKFFDYGNQLIISRGFMDREKYVPAEVDGDTIKELAYEQFVGKLGTGGTLSKQKDIAYYSGDVKFFGASGAWDPLKNKQPEAVGIDLSSMPKNKDNSPALSNGVVIYIDGFTSPLKIISVTEWSPGDPAAPSGIEVTLKASTQGLEFLDKDDLEDAFKNQDASVIDLPSADSVLSLEELIGKPGKLIQATVNLDFRNKVSVGDYIAYGNTIDSAMIVNIKPDITDSGFIIEAESIFPEAGPTTDLGQLENSKIWLLSNGHHNGGTQAYLRGDIDPTTNEPIYNNSADDNLNIDVPYGLSEKRLSYSYDLIKNDLDFEYKHSNEELNTFYHNMKLKFFSKYASTSKIEIAIANSYDFKTDQGGKGKNENYAIAFQEKVGPTVEYTYLNSLFDYTPAEDEFCIAIRKDGEIETFTVSLDPMSTDGNNKNNYVETVINENSKFVYVVDNQGIDDLPASYLVCDRYGMKRDGTLNPGGRSSEILTVQGGRNPVLDEGALKEAYFTVEDKEKYEIDVVIGNEEFINVGIELADTRKDCICYVGARYGDTVGKKANDATNAILTFLKGESGEKPTRTMFAAFFVNYFRIYDKYNRKYRWINVAGDMAGIRCDVTSANAPWWVSAGMKRGIIRSVKKMAFTPSQPQRDSLYKNGANPLVSFPGTGNLVWGNKTLHPLASSFDRINVRTLFNTLERSMAKAARSQVFEFNDPYTRNAIVSMFNPYLATIKAGRGIVDYLVICDETNNTPDVVSRNELRVDIYIKPNYAAEMILLTFTNVGTRSFADVVGV